MTIHRCIRTCRTLTAINNVPSVTDHFAVVGTDLAGGSLWWHKKKGANIMPKTYSSRLFGLEARTLVKSGQTKRSGARGTNTDCDVTCDSKIRSYSAGNRGGPPWGCWGRDEARKRLGEFVYLKCSGVPIAPFSLILCWSKTTKICF